jgi:hypothetical protein
MIEAAKKRFGVSFISALLEKSWTHRSHVKQESSFGAAFGGLNGIFVAIGLASGIFGPALEFPHISQQLRRHLPRSARGAPIYGLPGIPSWNAFPEM